MPLALPSLNRTIVAMLCGSALAAASVPVEAETLRLAHNLGQGGRESLDPISSTRFFLANQLLYSALVRPDAKGQPGPALAVSWSHSDDLKIWTFKLREGVRFHDGSPFDAADAAYSLRRILSPKIASPVRSVLGIMDTVEAVDPTTIRISLKQAHADFPLILMDYRVRVTSSQGRDDKLDELNETGIGTGPFKLTRLSAEGTTELAADPNHWEGKPGVDNVEIIAIPDAQARAQALLAGQIDVDGVNARQAALFAGRRDFVMQSVPTGNWNPLVMRTDTAPFTDARVRKALRILADRQAIVDTVLGRDGGVVGCDHPVWPGDPYHAGLTCPQDVEGAKRLLTEAGFPNGLEVDLYTSDVNSNMVQLAQVYQAQAAKAGVKVNIRMSPADGYWRTVWLNRPFVAGNWGQRPADQILNEAYRSGSRWNETSWNRPDFDALLDKARQSPAFEERKRLYGEAQRVLLEEGGSFVPFFDYDTRVMNAKVKGLDPVHDFFVRWHQIAKAD